MPQRSLIAKNSYVYGQLVPTIGRLVASALDPRSAYICAVPSEFFWILPELPDFKLSYMTFGSNQPPSNPCLKLLALQFLQIRREIDRLARDYTVRRGIKRPVRDCTHVNSWQQRVLYRSIFRCFQWGTTPFSYFSCRKCCGDYIRFGSLQFPPFEAELFPEFIFLCFLSRHSLVNLCFIQGFNLG